MTIRSEPQSDPPEPNEDVAAVELPRSAHTVSLRTILWGAILAAAFVVVPWAAGGAAPWNDRSGTDAASALKQVAGDESALRVGDECGEHAVACVFEGQSTVIVPPRYAELTDREMRVRGYGSWIDVMRHEYMHVLQHRLGTQLSEDANFLATFDHMPAGGEEYDDVGSWSMELSAECMAEVEYVDYRRSYPGVCDNDQLQFARTIVAQARAAR